MLVSHTANRGVPKLLCRGKSESRGIRGHGVKVALIGALLTNHMLEAVTIPTVAPVSKVSSAPPAQSSVANVMPPAMTGRAKATYLAQRLVPAVAGTPAKTTTTKVQINACGKLAVPFMRGSKDKS